MRALSLVISVLAFIFLVLIVTGYLIGPDYYEEQQFIVDYSPQNVWEILTDVENIKQGKNDIESIEIAGKYLNLYVWYENLEHGGYRKYRHNLKEENKRLIIEMTESSYSVTGTWEFDISEHDNKTLIKITENSTNTSIIGRGFRFFFGRDKETKDWIKFIRVRLFNRLLTTS